MSSEITMTETERGPVMTLEADTAVDTLDRLTRMVRADGVPVETWDGRLSWLAKTPMGQTAVVSWEVA